MVSYTLKGPLVKIKQQVFFSQMRPQLLQRVYWHDTSRQLRSGIVLGVSRVWNYEVDGAVTIGEPFENYVISLDFEYSLSPIYPKLTFFQIEKRENLTIEELLTHRDRTIRLIGLIKQKDQKRIDALINDLYSQLDKGATDTAYLHFCLDDLAKDLGIKVPDMV